MVLNNFAMRLNVLEIKLFIFMFACFQASAQKSYVSTSGEMIFSFARIQKNGADIESNLRWSPVFNWQGINNIDFGNHFGMFYGVAFRNVGFIYNGGGDTTKRHRTYNFGLPVGVKLGNLKGAFIWGGYEFEMPFHYKEKTFVGERKADKFDVWFSSRVNWYTQSVFVGINFKKGLNLKFKYYLDNFFNQNFTEANNIKPFSNMDVNVFYIALDVNVFKDIKKRDDKIQRKDKPARSTFHATHTSGHHLTN